MESATFVIIGGGIAGVSCAEQLTYLCPGETILILTASPLVKTVKNITQLTRTLEKFTVEETEVETFEKECSGIRVLPEIVKSLDGEKHIIHTKSGKSFKYEKLCICTGGYPKLIAEQHPHVIGIRDTESVQSFQKRIQTSRRIVIVGNGGIGTELVHELEGIEIIWAIKDSSISATFVDAGAAEFLLPELSKGKKHYTNPVKRMRYTVSDAGSSSNRSHAVTGSALGPDWHINLLIQGPNQEKQNVLVEYQCEISEILSPESVKETGKSVTHLFNNDENSWPVYVELTNGKVYGCDFIVSATGVIPNSSLFLAGNDLSVAQDQGIKVNDKMETSVPDVFAAGDVCTVSWKMAPHWFQMRLWTQARQMGMYAAKCMVASRNKEEILLDFCFEMFSHITKFFGYKVVLLGLYNGQGLQNKYDILLRMTKGEEYVKLILKEGKVHGAVLIGETDLEETFENLILNQMNVSQYGEDLLNPNIDIEDYFD